MCGKYSKSIEAHHIVGRTNRVLRWDLRNGISLCAGCHKLNRYSAHEDPLGFAKWYKQRYPDDYEYLMSRKNETWDKDYDRVIEYLEGVR